MKIGFHKYHALLNDFILIDGARTNLRKSGMTRFVKQICNRKSGVGADGVLLLSKRKFGEVTVDVYNADGGWAEKSGNGLRIAALHLSRIKSPKRTFIIEMGGSSNKVALIKRAKSGAVLKTELGVPVFRSSKIPARSKLQYMINTPLKVGGVNLPVTCLSIGNPHTVLFVENFNFDWKSLGVEIESHKIFPNGTNVEFVKVISSSRLKLSEWERGVGATGSSGTGAAAAVAAAVLLGLAKRKCKVEFDSGSLEISWRKTDNVLELTGPAEFVCEGIFEFL